MLNGKGDCLQADFGFHLGAVDRSSPAWCGRRCVLVLVARENIQGIEGGIVVLLGVICRQRDLDVGEGDLADHFLVAFIDNGGDFHDRPVGWPGRDIRCDEACAPTGGFRSVVAHIRLGEGFGGNGKLLAAVESGKQRHAHQYGRGNAGQERAGKPSERNFAAIGCTASFRQNWRFCA
ncbi:hypothetical protein D3C78_982120 [compost metagenome]